MAQIYYILGSQKTKRVTTCYSDEHVLSSPEPNAKYFEYFLIFRVSTFVTIYDVIQSNTSCLFALFVC